MSEATVIEASPVTPPKPEVSQFRREQWAFYCLLGDLLKTHKGQHVAVVNKQVVESGTDPVEVAKKVYARFGNVPMYIGLVSDEPPPIERVPRFRAR